MCVGGCPSLPTCLHCAAWIGKGRGNLEGGSVPSKSTGAWETQQLPHHQVRGAAFGRQPQTSGGLEPVLLAAPDIRPDLCSG